MNQHKGKYDLLMRPMNLLLDSIILLFVLSFYSTNIVALFTYRIYIVGSWLVLAYFTKFYAVFRYTKPVTIIRKISVQFFIYTLLLLSYFSVIKNKEFSRLNVFFFILYSLLLITLLKVLIFYLLKNYRLKGKNYRNVIIIGYNKQTKRLKAIFEEKPFYGYHFQGFFAPNKNENTLGGLEDAFNFVKNKEISEVYCSIAELTDSEIKKCIDFGDDNFVKIKFIPDDKAILKNHLTLDYYENFPILSIKKRPLDEPHNQILKRLFDIIFSSVIIVTVLSWLTPLMYFLIKRESKGPLFFKQKRNGLDQSTFNCYKFRSMTVNDKADTHQVKRGDMRITKTGEFIRKTSIDELPQFFNVFLGDMSVVGPRPHMVNETNKFNKKIDKFMMRHLVKPGITGLAQVKGCRGEIETDKDIINRYRYDIMYIEKWSFIMDIKIIIQTLTNAIRGEEKAY
jgi:putative colanic acid biosynthesis UDP-glucose lipid carrier transferase